jgi:hypothetical protein
MKRLLEIIMTLVIVAAPSASIADGPVDDPFEGGMAVEYSAEFFTLGTRYDTHDTTLQSLGFLYQSDLDTLIAGTICELGTLPEMGSIRDVLAADFDGDCVDEVLVAWSRPDGGVFVGIVEPDPDSMGVDTAAWHMPDSPGAPGMLYASDSLAHVLGEIRVVAADFYPDAGAEFVLAYLAADSTVRVSVFDVDSASLKPVELHAISDQRLDTWMRRGQRFGPWLCRSPAVCPSLLCG